MTRMWIKFGFLVVLLSLISAGSADAARKRVPGQYGTSAQPYWQVGALNQKLSSACQRGEFGQRAHLRLSIGYVGQKGRGITGIATSNWNLLDIKGLAVPRKTYHFFNQGYSNCKVYVSDTPRRGNRNR